MSNYSIKSSDLLEILLVDSKDILQKLLAFPTVSKDSNLDLIKYVEEYFNHHGIASKIIYNEDNTKANLWAAIGPAIEGGVALSGHSDVVPTEGQAWTVNPFEYLERNGLIYGRGSADMKGFIACALALVPLLKSYDLKTPIHFAFSYDEETGCAGAPRMIAEMLHSAPSSSPSIVPPSIVPPSIVPPSIVIVGEPSDMKLVSGHKGGREYTTLIKGCPGHSSQPGLCVNAVIYAAHAIQKLAQLAEKLAQSADPNSPYTPGASTLSIGPIQGGYVLNIIPEYCEFVWEIRPIPGDDIEWMVQEFNDFCQQELIPQMQAIAPEANITTECVVQVPGLQMDLVSPAEQLVRQLWGGNDQRVVAYCTEAGQFQEAGFSSVILGPGNIEQAHKPDEYVSISQIKKCLEFLILLSDHCIHNSPQN